MLERNNFQLSFENLRLNNPNEESIIQDQSDKGELQELRYKFLKFTFEINSILENPKQSEYNLENLIRSYNENFIIISQKEKAAYFHLSLTDIIKYFSKPLCMQSDGRTECKMNCECLKSLDIGMQFYDRGGVHSFYQFGNLIMGYLVEQQTDPLTRISIEFDRCSFSNNLKTELFLIFFLYLLSTMKNIQKIYCPCKFYCCPHAFAVLYYRIKVNTFYGIKLPKESKI